MSPYLLLQVRAFDTHQHLICPEIFDYPWIDSAPALQRSFTIEQYQSLIKDFPIEGSLFIEVDPHEQQLDKEASHFCQLAENSDNKLKGVIASARPEYPNFERYLDSISHPALKGIRRVLYTQAVDLPSQYLFKENVKQLGPRKLTFDLCVSETQYPACYELIMHCPETTFILDHCGRPQIAEHDFAAWESSLQKLADCPNLYCKLSGIIEQISPQDNALEKLSPYFNTCLELFGADRILWGSDWPVCELGGGLDNWLDCTKQYAAKLSADEQDAWLYGNAAKLY
ncbi:MAG: amidohydrolase family protein, partial [Opitutales bacterium]|nr:amidohydrolase family protein [Opitutales bacterium]